MVAVIFAVDTVDLMENIILNCPVDYFQLKARIMVRNDDARAQE